MIKRFLKYLTTPIIFKVKLFIDSDKKISKFSFEKTNKEQNLQ